MKGPPKVKLAARSKTTIAQKSSIPEKSLAEQLKEKQELHAKKVAEMEAHGVDPLAAIENKKLSNNTESLQDQLLLKLKSKPTLKHVDQPKTKIHTTPTIQEEILYKTLKKGIPIFILI